MSQYRPGQPGWVSRALDAARAALLSPIGIGVLSVCCLAAADLLRRAGVEPGFGFLRWNLLLAWIPLVLAYPLSWAVRYEATRLVLPALAAAWIIFLPNAPYLVTDLVHLRENVNAPNLVTLSLFAITGLLIGVKSVQIVQCAVEELFGTRAGRRAVQVVAVLTAFGVYLGRVQRWNSWSVIAEPRELGHAVLASPSDPGRVVLALLGTPVFAIGFYLACRVLTGSGVESAGPRTGSRIGRRRALRARRMPWQ